MGLSFLHVDPTNRALLALVLRGLPPPLPKTHSVEAPVIVSVDGELEHIFEHDGLRLVLSAEAPLLSACRPKPLAADPVVLASTTAVSSAGVLRRRFRSYRYRAVHERDVAQERETAAAPPSRLQGARGASLSRGANRLRARATCH
jgi:hypothetical protein